MGPVLVVDYEVVSSDRTRAQGNTENVQTALLLGSLLTFVLLAALMYVTADAEALSDFRFSVGDFATGEGADGPLAETVSGG